MSTGHGRFLSRREIIPFPLHVHAVHKPAGPKPKKIKLPPVDLGTIQTLKRIHAEYKSRGTEFPLTLSELRSLTRIATARQKLLALVQDHQQISARLQIGTIYDPSLAKGFRTSHSGAQRQKGSVLISGQRTARHSIDSRAVSYSVHLPGSHLPIVGTLVIRPIAATASLLANMATMHKRPRIRQLLEQQLLEKQKQAQNALRTLKRIQQTTSDYQELVNKYAKAIQKLELKRTGKGTLPQENTKAPYMQAFGEKKTD